MRLNTVNEGHDVGGEEDSRVFFRSVECASSFMVGRANTWW